MTPRRASATAVAASLSVLGTLGLGRAIDAATRVPAEPQPAGRDRAASSRRGPAGPDSLLVIRRSHPIVVTSEPQVVTAPQPAAPEPDAPTTRSS